MGVCIDTEKCIVSELMGGTILVMVLNLNYEPFLLSGAGGSIEDLVMSQFHVLEANAYLRPRIILNVARGAYMDQETLDHVS